MRPCRAGKDTLAGSPGSATRPVCSRPRPNAIGTSPRVDISVTFGSHNDSGGSLRPPSTRVLCSPHEPPRQAPRRRRAPWTRAGDTIRRCARLSAGISPARPRPSWLRIPAQLVGALVCQLQPSGVYYLCGRFFVFFYGESTDDRRSSGRFALAVETQRISCALRASAVTEGKQVIT